jgi:hypothetical protein
VDDSFKTSTGLADEMRLEVRDAAFVLDPKYNRDGELIPLLKLTGIATIDGVPRELSETYGVGKGWTIDADGSRATSATHSKFNSNTAYGKFIDAFVAVDGAVDILDKIPGASALVAETWVGFTLDLERSEPETFNIRGEAKPVTRNGILLPVAVVAHNTLGVQQELPDATADATLPADVKSELENVALKVDTFEEFIAAAYELGTIDGQPFEDHVADDSPAGFYATVKA